MSGRISGSRSGKAQFTEQMSSSPRGSHDDPQRVLTPSYGTGAFVSHPFSRQPYIGTDIRPQSSSSNMTTSSSLSGAINDINTFPHLRSADKTRTGYNMESSSQMGWLTGQHDHLSAYLGSNPDPHMQHLGGSYHNYQDINITTNPSPESISPNSPAFPSTYTSQMAPQQNISPHASSRSGVASPFSASEPYLGTPMMGVTRPQSQADNLRHLSRTRHTSMEDEVHHLRKKVRELELVNQSDRMRIKELEAELASGPTSRPYRQHEPSSTNVSSLNPAMTPQNAPSSSIWKARTEARIRVFCSLNRAGNALCSWHDSRRERRAYPPRMAPAGHLNCGCTFEQALFEESLSRHGVGSYHPGETVRMDPALRNPLLQLLQKRYGYRDGDFERDPVTGDWVEGEGHVYWEQKAMSGAITSRKSRGDERR
ncbi:hypothetical protein BJ138DRAFT_1153130 [Hygrophoropsis aurantiaca]|uniref:Uncharacterized protein n=1 Tax=Hygrophoropsis aurantiaca TaxID=72124 RepID=A0ACB8AAQ2_9AGAM|nr:hypothetical protein BJ138DRAFT_1153130 [Hygrophoropsis aurantiaca]